MTEHSAQAPVAVEIAPPQPVDRTVRTAERAVYVAFIGSGFAFASWRPASRSCVTCSTRPLPSSAWSCCQSLWARWSRSRWRVSWSPDWAQPGRSSSWRWFFPPAS